MFLSNKVRPKISEFYGRVLVVVAPSAVFVLDAQPEPVVKISVLGKSAHIGEHVQSPVLFLILRHRNAGSVIPAAKSLRVSNRVLESPVVLRQIDQGQKVGLGEVKGEFIGLFEDVITLFGFAAIRRQIHEEIFGNFAFALVLITREIRPNAKAASKFME